MSRRRIAVNFLALAGTNVFGLLVTILISVYVRRAMGPAIGPVSWAMAAVASQAPLAVMFPEGRCARGPSMRSALTCSMIACPRCWDSAWVSG